MKKIIFALLAVFALNALHAGDLDRFIAANRTNKENIEKSVAYDKSGLDYRDTIRVLIKSIKEDSKKFRSQMPLDGEGNWGFITAGSARYFLPKERRLDVTALAKDIESINALMVTEYVPGPMERRVNYFYQEIEKNPMAIYRVPAYVWDYCVERRKDSNVRYHESPKGPMVWANRYYYMLQQKVALYEDLNLIYIAYQHQMTNSQIRQLGLTKNTEKYGIAENNIKQQADAFSAAAGLPTI